MKTHEVGRVHALGDLFIWFLDYLQPSSHYIWESYWKLFTVTTLHLNRQYQLSETVDLAWALKSRNQNPLMKNPEAEARSQQNPLHNPPNILSSWPIFMNIMMQGTTGAKTAIPSAGPCLIFSHTCIIRNTDRPWILTTDLGLRRPRVRPNKTP